MSYRDVVRIAFVPAPGAIERGSPDEHEDSNEQDELEWRALPKCTINGIINQSKPEFASCVWIRHARDQTCAVNTHHGCQSAMICDTHELAIRFSVFFAT